MVSPDGYTVEGNPNSHWGPRNAALMFRSQDVYERAGLTELSAKNTGMKVASSWKADVQYHCVAGQDPRTQKMMSGSGPGPLVSNASLDCGSRTLFCI